MTGQQGHNAVKGKQGWQPVIKTAPNKGVYDVNPDIDDDRGHPIKEYRPFVSAESKTGKPVEASMHTDTITRLRDGAAETLAEATEKVRRLDVALFARIAAQNPDIRTVNLRVIDFGAGDLGAEAVAYGHNGHRVDVPVDTSMLSKTTLGLFLDEQRDDYSYADEVTVEFEVANWVA